MSQEAFANNRAAEAPLPLRPRRGGQEIGATVVLMSALAALGYVLVSEKHSRELADLRQTWSEKIRDIEARAAAAESAASKLSEQASRLAAELPVLTAARDELQKKLASAEATIATERAQAHRELAQAEDMNASLRRELEAVLDEYTKALVDADRDRQRVMRQRDDAVAARERLEEELAEAKAAYAKAESEAGQIVARLVEIFPALATNLTPATPAPEPAPTPSPQRLAEQAPAPTATPQATPAAHRAGRPGEGLYPLVQDLTGQDWGALIHGYMADLLELAGSSAPVRGGGSGGRAALPAESF
jgi:hypothetical protein